MRVVWKRVLFMGAAAALAAVCGIASGYVLGRLLVLSMTKDMTRADANRILSRTINIAGESNALLQSIADSKYPPCSEQEVAWFRKQILHAEFLKDAGRMSAGKIQCSAALGRDNLPATTFTADQTQANGTRLYRTLAPYQSGDQAMGGMERGGAFIIYGPNLREYIGGASPHYIVTMIDTPGRPQMQVGRDAGLLTGKVTEESGEGLQQGYVYVTRCSIASHHCVSAFIAASDSLARNRTMWQSFAALGGFTGALLGIFLVLVYWRGRGMVAQLRRAIAMDKLRVVFQPIVNVQTRRIESAEALARWNDEDGQPVSPEIFIRIAEEKGFVGSITRLVVHLALREFAAILQADPEFRLAVNVTAADLADPAFQPMLREELARAGVAPSSLVIEITEGSTALREDAIRTIRELHDSGHNVHIDDFGTGYSSLSYLQHLSVDAIKIDRSFAKGVGAGAASMAILPRILSMADALKLHVVVEGIETEEQARYYASIGNPRWAQGYHFGYPIAIDEFRRRLAAQKAESTAPPRVPVSTHQD